MMFLMPFNCTVEKDEIKAKRIAAPCSKQRAPRICQPTTTRELITNSASHTPSPAEVGPTCQPQEALFFFLSSLAFFPFSIGGTKARAITSQHGKQKNTHKFTGNSLYRGKVNFGGGGGGETLTHQETPPGPNSGPNWERKKAAAEARSELCGASGVLGGEGGEDWWVLGEARRGGENSTRFSSLLSSSCLVFSSPRRRRCVWPSAAGCLCQPFYLGLLRYRMTCP